MTHLAWVHQNCKFVAARNEAVWKYLDSLGDKWEFGPLVKSAQTTQNIQMYDIVLIRKTQIGESSDTRPALVTRLLGNGMFEVSPITTQTGLSSSKNSMGDFPVLPDHQDFGSTKLRKPSVIKDVPLTVSSDNVMKIGHLSGSMLAHFLDHTGREPAAKPAAQVFQKPVAPPRPQQPQPQQAKLPVKSQPVETVAR